MTASIKSNSDGVSAELQVNGVTALKLVQGQAVPTSSTLTDGATINWDGNANGQVVSLTIAGNRTVNAPTNIQQNALYLLRLSQDATGSRTLSWNAAYKFGGSGAPTLTTTASKTDILSFMGGAGNTLEFIGIRKNAV